VQVAPNRRALQLGRLWVHDAGAIERWLGKALPQTQSAEPQTLDQVVQERVALLVGYQDERYAQRYQRLVGKARDAERRATGTEGEFSMAVARGFGRLMAYKDEYEVARLYSLPSFRQSIEAEFEDIRELRVNLAPPLLTRRDPATGRPRKREYGPWIFTAMKMLARFRGLRGTALDPFGRTVERRAERGWVDDYERRISALAADLDAARLPLATRFAAVAEQVRGFGPVKAVQMKLAARQWGELERDWAAASQVKAAAKPVEGPAPRVAAAGG
jgi:indolepyruvate ferredoxin oxidoreductase